MRKGGCRTLAQKTTAARKDLGPTTKDEEDDEDSSEEKVVEQSCRKVISMKGIEGFLPLEV
jgi:hypothetical protein